MQSRYYAAEDPELVEDACEPTWRVYDRESERRSVLLTESQAERAAYDLNRPRRYASEEEADQAADNEAPFWGEE
jgi:hypothetical protein